MQDGSVTDNPAMQFVEEAHLAERQRQGRNIWVMRPYAVGLEAQHGAGQSGRHPIVAAEKLDAEQWIMRGNLRRSRNGIVGRRARLRGFLLKAPGLATVAGRDDRSFQT